MNCKSHLERYLRLPTCSGVFLGRICAENRLLIRRRIIKKTYMREGAQLDGASQQRGTYELRRNYDAS